MPKLKNDKTLVDKFNQTLIKSEKWGEAKGAPALAYMGKIYKPKNYEDQL